MKKQTDETIPWRKCRIPRSQPKTAAEVLRRIIAPDADLEELLGQSKDWRTKLCAGKIPVTRAIAIQIESETGIASSWLLGNPDQTPVDESGRPYTIETFRWWRSMIQDGEWPRRKAAKPSAFLPQLVAVGCAAGKAGKLSLFLEGLQSFIDDAKMNFGTDCMAGRRAASALAKSPLLERVILHDDGFDSKHLEPMSDPLTLATQRGDSKVYYEMSRIDQFCRR
ncbi:MAG: hypothetical protein H0W20_12360 [Chthoniobacterales bacterium]|nr:hypothetical protein [Chthoniobacterales bacterium]